MSKFKPAGPQLGPFEIGQDLSSGQFSSVKLARHAVSHELVVIKTISKAFMRQNQDFHDKVYREIAVLKLLNHPGAVKLYDVYDTDHFLFLVMEYAENGELFDYIIEKGRLDPDAAVVLFQQIVSCMEYAARRGICHRDLKPENLLLDARHRIKIGDWGFAKIVDTELNEQGICGSVDYAAPELLGDNPKHTTASDIWSIGVILYAILTGRLPFDTTNIIESIKQAIFHLPEELPDDCKQILSKLLEKNVEKRLTFDQIKQEPYFKRIPYQFIVDDPFMKSHLPPVNEVKAVYLRHLVDLNLGSQEQLVASLKSDQQNNLKQFYKDIQDHSGLKYAKRDGKEWAGELRYTL